MNMTQAMAMLSEFPRFFEHPLLIPFLTITMIIIMIITIKVMWCTTQRQINEMRKIENDKRIIAAESLIYELEQNKN